MGSSDPPTIYLTTVCATRSATVGTPNSRCPPFFLGMGNLGLVYSAQGKVEYAMQHHLKALEIAQSVSDRSGVATQLANIGFVSSKMHNFEDAVRFHLQAVEIEKSLGRKAAIARELDNLAGAYCALGQMEKAAKAGEAGLELYKELYGVDDPRAQHRS